VTRSCITVVGPSRRFKRLCELFQSVLLSSSRGPPTARRISSDLASNSSSSSYNSIDRLSPTPSNDDVCHTVRCSKEKTYRVTTGGISGNLEILGNSAKVGQKSAKGPKSGTGQGICLVGETWLWQFNKITYLYFIPILCAFVRHIACNFARKSRELFLSGEC